MSVETVISKNHMKDIQKSSNDDFHINAVKNNQVSDVHLKIG